jgi:hypothetical protein
MLTVRQCKENGVSVLTWTLAALRLHAHGFRRMPVAQRSEFQGRHRAPRPQGSLLRRIIETIEAAE